MEEKDVIPDRTLLSKDKRWQEDVKGTIQSTDEIFIIHDDCGETANLQKYQLFQA